MFGNDHYFLKDILNFLQLKEEALRTSMVELNHESFYERDLAYAVDVGSLMFPILFPYINFLEK